MDPTPNAGQPLPHYTATITFVPDTPRRGPRIDLNRSSVEELAMLPGIGPATAKRIVTARAEREFRHPSELVDRGLVAARLLPGLLALSRATVSDIPHIADVMTDPENVRYHEPFVLSVRYEDSAAGVRLVRLQADSISHSLDFAREVTADETASQRIDFELPAMEDGPMNVEVTLYDAKGGKGYLARTIQVLHNPPSVNVFPSERTARLSNGAALFKSDGNFHCDSGWSITNATGNTTSLNPVLNGLV